MPPERTRHHGRQTDREKDPGEPVTHLKDRHLQALELVVDDGGQLTARDVEDRLEWPRRSANTYLRALEQGGLLEGELIGGGRLGYRALDGARTVLAARPGAERSRCPVEPMKRRQAAPA
jgi:DNA-binding IclR family transcriptional regulator